jgi:hypothetical protein
MSAAATPAPAPVPSTYDINTRVDEVFAEHGFATTNSDGDIVRNKQKMIATIVDVLISSALAGDADERVAKAMSKWDLYESVFRNGPKLNDRDEVEREAADYVATYVWSTTTPSYDGRVQRELGNRSGHSDLVLCRRKIGGVPSIYITRTDELIVDDFVMPASERIVKVADKTRKDMALVMHRRPSLEARVKGELESMATRTSIALGANAARALGPGN